MMAYTDQAILISRLFCFYITATREEAAFMECGSFDRPGKTAANASVSKSADETQEMAAAAARAKYDRTQAGSAPEWPGTYCTTYADVDHVYHRVNLVFLASSAGGLLTLHKARPVDPKVPKAHLVTCELAGGRFVLVSEVTLLNAILPEQHGAARTAAEPGSRRRCVPDYYCFSPLPALKVGPDSGLGCDCVVYSDEDMDLVRQQV